jgi:ligand-binding sensor domain-containing protein
MKRSRQLILFMIIKWLLNHQIWRMVIRRGLLIAALIGLNCVAHIARERVQRRFDSATGLQISTIFSLCQDIEGFIWIGTAGGLVRYDGNQIRRWAPEIINHDVFILSVSGSGEVVVAQGEGTLYRVTPDGVVPVHGPNNHAVTNVINTAFDDAGGLWVLASDGLKYRDAQNHWIDIDVIRSFSGQRVRRLRPSNNGQIYVITDVAVWQMRSNEPPRRIVDLLRVVDVVEHPGGSLFVMVWSELGEIFEVQPGGRIIRRSSTRGRPIDLVVRRNVVWAAFDRYLLALRPDEPPEEIGPADALPGGGPLLVDHEGSLWLGTFSGLIQYPEPETTIWNQKDGLPSAHLRSVARTGEGIWALTWHGLGRVQREHGVWHVYDEKVAASRPCADNREILIFNSYPIGLVQRIGGRFVQRPPLPAGVGLFDCTHASDGSLLLATTDGILRTQPDVAPLEEVSSPMSGNERSSVSSVFEDNAQRLWAATEDGRVCKADAHQVLASQSANWSCQEIAQLPNIFDIAQLPGSSLWMSNTRSGVWRYRQERWEPIPGSKSLPSQVVFSLTPSRSEGVWLVGQGIAMRAVDRPDLPEGWQIVEAMSAWEGLPGSEITEMVEEPEGDIWLSTPSGLVHVPPEARRLEASPPRVQLIDVVINGQTANRRTGDLSLPHNSNVELHFSALSYRDRSRLRYQYRLRPHDPWINSRDAAPVLRFVDLRPGNYQVEVRASLDGNNWTSQPASLGFTVLNPWYLRPITLVLVALVCGTALYAIYRARIGMLTRLERQRSRIAMDLHDQMGSGLGSIGILSGLAAQDNLEGVSRRDLAEKIAATAGELGNSLSEIVWALRPEAVTLEAFAYHVAERGGRLFPTNVPAFATEFPSRWPRVELSLAVRRNLLLIAAEALHNAARHSEAETVKLGIAPIRGKHWRLWISDDGCGLSNEHAPSSGSRIGLTSMQRRAEEIGATISWSTTNGQGTTLTVVFDPQADDKGFD